MEKFLANRQSNNPENSGEKSKIDQIRKGLISDIARFGEKDYAITGVSSSFLNALKTMIELRVPSTKIIMPEQKWPLSIYEKPRMVDDLTINDYTVDFGWISYKLPDQLKRMDTTKLKDDGVPYLCVIAEGSTKIKNEIHQLGGMKTPIAQCWDAWHLFPNMRQKQLPGDSKLLKRGRLIGKEDEYLDYCNVVMAVGLDPESNQVVGYDATGGYAIQKIVEYIREVEKETHKDDPNNPCLFPTDKFHDGLPKHWPPFVQGRESFLKFMKADWLDFDTFLDQVIPNQKIIDVESHSDPKQINGTAFSGEEGLK